MTKYILHGGRTSNKTWENKEFFQEIVKGVKQPIILLINFAAIEKRWPELIEQEKQQFVTYTKHPKLKFLEATKNPQTLVSQIKKANIIYLRGGKDDSLKKPLKDLDLKKLFKNKIIAGTSAGANLLVKYYFSNKKDRVRFGQNILPIKIFCHYNKTKSTKLTKLKSFRENLPILTLKEWEHKVIKI